MTLLWSILLACQPETTYDFSTSGNNSVRPNGSLTGRDDTEDGTTEAVNPVISAVSGFFFEDAGKAMIEMHVFVLDPQDDLLNGSIELDFSWGDQSESTSLSIDGDTVVVETGEITFWIEDVDMTATYDVFVTVFDEVGNPSEQMTAQVSPE